MEVKWMGLSDLWLVLVFGKEGEMKWMGLSWSEVNGFGWSEVNGFELKWSEWVWMIYGWY